MSSVVKGCWIFSSNEYFGFLNNLTYNHKLLVCCPTASVDQTVFMSRRLCKNCKTVKMFYSANMFLFLKWTVVHGEETIFFSLHANDTLSGWQIDRRWKHLPEWFDERRNAHSRSKSIWTCRVSRTRLIKRLRDVYQAGNDTLKTQFLPATSCKAHR